MAPWFGGSAAARPVARGAAAPPPGAARDATNGNDPKAMRWGLLMPITSRGSAAQVSWARLAATSARLVASVPWAHQCDTVVYIGLDSGDAVYDTPAAFDRLKALYAPLAVVFHAFPPAFAGKMCWLCAQLAEQAVQDGADLFVLLGDDVTLHDDDWQGDVESCFLGIARDRGLPLGCACVAVQDDAFPAFPTFPVLHALHLKVFGHLFPREFESQHGDPFLFEVYRRFGAARFCEKASLSNGIGGVEASRYDKTNAAFVWRDKPLSRAVDEMNCFLCALGTCGSGTAAWRRWQCLDVNIPTFRCDADALKDLVAGVFASCGGAFVSLRVLIVVDRPDAADLKAILALQSYETDRIVRVFVNCENRGASATRNVGLSQSFGDWAVLLDDDVRLLSGDRPTRPRSLPRTRRLSQVASRQARRSSRRTAVLSSGTRARRASSG